MKNQNLFSALVLGIVLGCAGSELVRSNPPVTAQPSASGQFRECVLYSQLGHDSDPEDLPTNATPIPAGWTVMNATDYGMLLCR